MGRSPCWDENGLKKGPWTPEEDQKLIHYIKKHGHGSWRALPKLAGLNRCGKSCRLRWTNYLRPDIKRGKFSPEEEETILSLHAILGNKWSAIASHLPGRTDNEIKNFWNTHLKKKLIQMGFDPMTHRPRTDYYFSALPQLVALANLGELIDGRRPWDDHTARLQAEALQAAKLQHLLQSATTTTANGFDPNGHAAAAADLEAMSLLGSQMVPSFPPLPQPPSFLCELPTNQQENRECYSMAGFGQEENSSRTSLLAPPHHSLLPPPTEVVSVVNHGDGRIVSSYNSNETTSNIWPELLLDNQFMAEFS